MWRIAKPVMPLVIALLLVFSSIPAVAQSLPDKNEVREWIKKAQEASDLRSPGAAPYHLVAKIRYAIGDKTMDGTYEILWAAPDRYRVEFRMGDIGETDLVLGDKKYVERNTPTMTLPMWSVSSILFFSAVLPIAPPPSPVPVHKLSRLGDGANRQICAIVGESVTSDHELCFNADTTELTATHIHPRAHSSLVGAKLALDFTDYVSLGKMRYPQRMIRVSGPEAIDATVEKWEAVQKFDENVFVPLSNSVVWDWCSMPEIKMPKSNGPSVPPVSVNPVTGTLSIPFFGLYKVVRADGTVKEATLLFGDPEGPAKELLARQRHDRSAVHVCGGKPVEYESMFVMWSLSPVH
jgi:hypothetical protein